MALISALLLLLVMTIMAVGMFHSFGLQEKIAGNTREKQRSLHAAESAQAYAEWWLTSGNGLNTLNTPVACAKQVSADLGNTQICSTALANPADVVSWTNTGNTYTPPGLTVGTGGADTYFGLPTFNISFLYAAPFNTKTKTQTSFYQVDALGYGGTGSAASVVESMYEVNLTYGATGSSGSHGRFVDLGGP
jgi:type IV pilus assembly protein PilX